MITRTSNKVVSGVCGGIAKRLDLEPWLVRFIFVGSIFFFGTGLFFYFLLSLSLPREDRISEAYDKRVLGVCASVAQRSEMEVGLIRFLALLLLFTSFGTVTLIYVVLYFALPTQLTPKVEVPPKSYASPEPSQNGSSNS